MACEAEVLAAIGRRCKGIAAEEAAGTVFGVTCVSQCMTLVPGDIIHTGTLGATDRLNPGGVCEVEIDGIGILRNRVVAQQT